MLGVPDVGFERSVVAHNVDLVALCDWIEGSILFFVDEISQSDIVDVLCELNIYEKQDMASVIVSDAWAELRRRQLAVKNSGPFEVKANRIERLVSWEQAPAHSFCVLVSLARCYRKITTLWTEKYKDNYIEQGRLFEELTKESLEAQFSDWKFYLTGWSRENPTNLLKVVDDISGLLGERKGEVEVWANENENEEGLDLLCYRPFFDERVGIPVYLMQCASGADWKQKARTPDLSLWTKIVQFASPPQKAFSTPLSFLDDEFRKACVRVDGMLLDRYRLLAASSYCREWESSSLKKRLNSWTKKRISMLPRIDK